jgi:hypothetical protein
MTIFNPPLNDYAPMPIVYDEADWSAHFARAAERVLGGIDVFEVEPADAQQNWVANLQTSRHIIEGSLPPERQAANVFGLFANAYKMRSAVFHCAPCVVLWVSRDDEHCWSCSAGGTIMHDFRQMPWGKP